MRQVDTLRLREWLAQDAGPSAAASGRVLVVAGSRHTPGAARLAAEGALRGGAEKVQVVTVRSTAAALAVAVPELLVAGVAETPDGEIAASAFGLVAEMSEQADVVLLGPGFMSPQAAVDLCRPLLKKVRARLVLDALAMAFFAAEPAFLLPDGQAILTPNEGEVGLALGVDAEDLDGEVDGGALRLARRARAVVTAGGATTFTATPAGRLWRDEAGHGGMGASGSGDVKAGIVAATFARDPDPEQAALWGGHIHALAGELVASEVGPVGYLASEVVAAVPRVLVSRS